MSNIDKRALREELSNPAIGSNAHLRKLALALLDELEAKDKLNAELIEKQRLIDICQGQGLEHRIAAEKRAEAAEKRASELECITGALRELRPSHITIAGEKIGIYMRDEVDAALGSAGIAKGE
ncbi:hypothetical protein ACSN7S_001546 [Enterobacter hormaechei]|uniref:hypothetical protein n=1 Tax=Enterobacter hormaechei TaxID=158836 RepID=UPI00044E5F23|nr:hypothetical protein [Enterobacter hormaechei]EUL92840.1 hypothetical protein P826_02628 [Enterobacter hormaechei]TBV80887.1 hypothetical protein E0F01_15195 [Enterobacter hormaechei]TKY76910.1 hypothetical protein E0F19_016710 [Enterobacter hormaechei]